MTLGTTRADELQLLWQQGPADGVPYLGTGNTDRGVAYNPVTGHVLVVSRASLGSGEVYILDRETGAQLGMLSLGTDLIAGGTFVLSYIGVADDGVIYVANLTTSTVTPEFRVYRWEDETAEPTLAYVGEPSGGDATSLRWGDSFDVRGAGTNTQWVAGAGGSSTIGAVFTTTDGLTFTPTKITNIAANSVAFGAGNTIWTKRNAAALRQVAFNLTTGVGTVQTTVSSTIVPNTMVPIGVNGASNLLAGITINAAADDLRLYDISLLNDIAIIDQEVFPEDNANGNAAGAVDLSGDIVVALDTNNGLMVYRILKTVSPPAFTSQPLSATILEGGTGNLSAVASGTRPLTFQWQVNGTDLTRGTNATLLFSAITLDEAGTYTLIASNAAGAMTSNPAIISVEPLVRSDRATVLWRVAPRARPYLTADGNTERGIAYNSASNRVLVVSRTSGVNIHVLDGDTGADLWTLQTPTNIIGATASTPNGFRLNMIGVADDGVVYAANLTTGAAESGLGAFRIYRWENDTTNAEPVEVYSGAPVAGRRFGDTFDVRGAGNDTQILLGNNVSAAEPDNTTVIMTTSDSGLSWTPNVITTPGVDDDYFRLGISFGSSNTFWGKTTGQPLRQVQFDLAAGVGTLVQTYSNVTSFASAVSFSSNLVAVLALENPDNLRLYEMSTSGQELTLIDQELFAADNANANGTGSADFGDDRLYVVDTNNGLLALKLGGGGTTPSAATFANVSGTQNTLNFTLSGTPNATYRIQSTTDFSSWSEVQTAQVGAGGSVTVSLNTGGGNFRFYRAVAQ